MEELSAGRQPEEFMSLTELSAFLGIPRSTIKKRVLKARLPGRLRGPVKFYRVREVVAVNRK